MAKKKKTKAREPNKMGRPTKYSKEVADKICNIIATSNKGLHTISRMGDEFPSAKVMFDWLAKHDYFRDNYVSCKKLQAEYLGEELIDIADDSSNDTMIIETSSGEKKVENREWINRSRLRVDTRKWVMSKLLPKKYGDKIDVTSDNKPITQTIQVISEKTKKEIDKLK